LINHHMNSSSSSATTTSNATEWKQNKNTENN
jgi:hypothetical protein